MHELSIAISILDRLAEESERFGGAAVRAVHLRLGPLSGVVPEALASAYALAREHTPLADCELCIQETAVTVQCEACNAPRTLVSIQELRCPDCGAPTPTVLSGDELEVVAVRIAEPKP